MVELKKINGKGVPINPMEGIKEALVIWRAEVGWK
jgi:hypothetical protein